MACKECDKALADEYQQLCKECGKKLGHCYMCGYQEIDDTGMCKRCVKMANDGRI